MQQCVHNLLESIHPSRVEFGSRFCGGAYEWLSEEPRHVARFENENSPHNVPNIYGCDVPEST